MSAKYPRTLHLPFSPGGTRDDRRMADVTSLLGQDVVLTEKMDGSNVSLERNDVFARSHGGAPRHSSFDALKAHHSAVKHKISMGTQVFGEWLFARHSIHYEALPGYLMIFGVRAGDQWAPWEEVELWAQELGAMTAPVLMTGRFDTLQELQTTVERLAAMPSRCGGVREGVVVRRLNGFQDAEFELSVAKWVRSDHVQTDDHWSHQEVVRNGLVAL